MKFAAGDNAGGDEDAAAAGGPPPGGIWEILRMIRAGELPAPSSDPDRMDAWLEACRMAGGASSCCTGSCSRPPPSSRRRNAHAFSARLDETGAPLSAGWIRRDGLVASGRARAAAAVGGRLAEGPGPPGVAVGVAPADGADVIHLQWLQ